MMAILILLLVMAGCGGGNGEAVKANGSAVSTPTFQFTLAQFVDRYNQAMNSMDSEIEMKRGQSILTDDTTLVQLDSNRNVAAILDTDAQNGTVRSILFIAGGTGTISSGVDVILGLTGVVMAVENPRMPSAQRGEAIRDIGVLDLTDLSETGKRTQRGRFEYYLSFSDVIGATLMVTPLSNAE